MVPVKKEIAVTTPNVKIETVNPLVPNTEDDDDLDDDEDYYMEEVDSYSPPKNFRNGGDQDALIGKRVQRSLAGQDGGDQGGADYSSVYEETPQTPYPAGDTLNNMISRSDIKPFRNVIKRYWTEDEVNLSFA